MSATLRIPLIDTPLTREQDRTPELKMSSQWFRYLEQLARKMVPVGAIIMWSGILAEIPAGWALCDGTNGKPDLRNRFIYGAAAGGAAPGTVGGSANAVNISHNHSVSITSGGHSASHTHTATTGTESGLHAHGPGAERYVVSNVSGATLDFATIAGAAFSALGHNSANTNDVSHTHDVTTGGASNDHTHGVTGNTSTDGSAGTNLNMPPYYVLAFIMCVSTA